MPALIYREGRGHTEKWKWTIHHILGGGAASSPRLVRLWVGGILFEVKMYLSPCWYTVLYPPKYLTVLLRFRLEYSLCDGDNLRRNRNDCWHHVGRLFLHEQVCFEVWLTEFDNLQQILKNHATENLFSTIGHYRCLKWTHCVIQLD